MNNAISTAEELYSAMKEMPASEQVRFFTLLGERAFEKKNFSYKEVFGEVINAEFTASEAAEYLEISVPTFRRYVQAGKILPSHIVGRNQFFSAKDLKALKRALHDVKGH